MLFSTIYKHSLHIVRKSFAFTCLFIYLFEYKVRIKAYKTYPDIQLLRCINLHYNHTCLLYTSDAADDMQCVDLGGRRIIKKKC